MTVGRRAAVALVCFALAGCAGRGLTERHSTGHLDVDTGAATAWLNTYRKAHGMGAVAHDAALDAVAQAQADAMASANELSHTVAGPLPRRLASLGRDNSASAENVSAGYHDLQAALGGWQRSPEHNKNLLYAPIRRIGIAAAAAPDTRYKTFWALVMTD